MLETYFYHIKELLVEEKKIKKNTYRIGICYLYIV